MKKKRDFLVAWLWLPILLLFILPQSAFSYTNGQKLVVDGITYIVKDASKFTLAVGGTTKSGTVTVPSEIHVADGTFTVVDVLYDSGAGPEGSSNGYSHVTTLYLPNTLTSISSIVSSGIKELHLPASLQTITRSAFLNVGYLPNFVLDKDNKNFELDDNGILYTKGKEILIAVPSGINFGEQGILELPEGLKTIWLASISNPTIKKLVIPSTVTNIPSNWPSIIRNSGNITDIEVNPNNKTYRSEDGMLIRRSDNCLITYPMGRKDATLNIPESVTSIERNAVSFNSYITSVKLNNVEELGTWAIFQCNSLKELGIGSKLKTYNNGAIGKCRSFAKYTVSSDNPYLSSDEGGVLYNKDKTTLYNYPPAKEGDTFNIPETVSTIAGYAFDAARNIKSLTIPKTVKTIGLFAFSDMSSCTNFTFEEKSQVTRFEYRSFVSCTALKSITLPTSLKSFGTEVFNGCNALNTIIIPDGSQLQSLNSITSAKNVEKIVFEGSCTLTTINPSTFSYLTKLKEINLPPTLTTIGSNAFQGCTSLAKVTFGDNPSIQTIGQGAFANCGLTSIDIPSSVVTIDRDAFENCTALTSVNLSASTKTVSPEAFLHCSNLKEFNVDKNNPYYSSVNGYLLNKDKNKLIIFPPAKANADLTLLPPTLTEIGDFAFFDCPNLTNIVIPQKVAKIGARAFGKDTNLTSIAFLCDTFLDPSNINQQENYMSIDDGSQDPDMFKNINIYVRSDLREKYEASDYYKKFKNGSKIPTSFKTSHPGDKGTAGNEADEYFPLSDTGMMLLSTKAKVNTFVASDKVVNPSDNTERSVNMIADYAFEGSDVNEVVLKSNIRSIGALAFWTSLNKTTQGGVTKYTPASTTIKNIFFCGEAGDIQLATKDFELSDDSREFDSSNQHIYVRKSQLSGFKAENALGKYTSIIDYKIPGITIKNCYGSFSREFDTDLSEYFSENSGKARVAAFTGKLTGVIKGTGDNTETDYHIRMSSIDVNGGKSGDYGYIPANTGVLLKVLDGKTTPDGFWYAIGEEQGQYDNTVTGVMKGVTVNGSTLSAESGVTRYVLNGGVFRPVKSTISIPIHKAYLELDNPTNAKINLIFDGDEATGIRTVQEATNGDDEPVYNLQGQRVANPRHGVFIKGGRKIVVK